MAPRHVRRGCRLNCQDDPPRRSRYQRLLDVESDVNGYTEVPFYAAGRAPRTRKEAMKLKMGLKSGSTGYGLPDGMFGRIVYTLSQEENELLNSMLTVREAAMVVEINELIFGDWMTAILSE